MEEARGGEGLTGDQHLIWGGECVHRRERRNPIRSTKVKEYGATTGFLKKHPLVAPAFAPIVLHVCMYKHPNCVNTIINKSSNK